MTQETTLPKEGICKWCKHPLILKMIGRSGAMYYDSRGLATCPEHPYGFGPFIHELEGASSRVKIPPFKITLQSLNKLDPDLELEIFDDELGHRAIITEIVHRNEEVLKKVHGVLVSAGLSRELSMDIMRMMYQAGIVFGEAEK